MNPRNMPPIVASRLSHIRTKSALAHLAIIKSVWQRWENNGKQNSLIDACLSHIENQNPIISCPPNGFSHACYSGWKSWSCKKTELRTSLSSLW